MKIPALSGSGEGYALLIGVSALAIVGLYVFAKNQAAAAAKAALNVNAGTPYEGTGVVGTLGNVANQASGGALESFGAWLGGILPGSGNDYDPNAPAPGSTAAPASDGSVPLQSQKQAVSGGFWSDVESLFTPSSSTTPTQ